ncbi:hypothetical protein BsWGS_22663 [Bradybaena similaris]
MSTGPERVIDFIIIMLLARWPRLLCPYIDLGPCVLQKWGELLTHHNTSKYAQTTLHTDNLKQTTSHHQNGPVIHTDNLKQTTSHHQNGPVIHTDNLKQTTSHHQNGPVIHTDNLKQTSRHRQPDTQTILHTDNLTHRQPHTTKLVSVIHTQLTQIT